MNKYDDETIILNNKEFKEIKNGKRVEFKERMNTNINTDSYLKTIAINSMTNEQCSVFYFNGTADGLPCVSPWIQKWEK